MTKHTKAEVNYGQGHVQSHCGPVFHDDTHSCVHFRKREGWQTGLCSEVQGAIDPSNWCELWKRVTK